MGSVWWGCGKRVSWQGMSDWPAPISGHFVQLSKRNEDLM